MKITQATFPDNKHIAFIQLSDPNQLFQGGWAERNQRVMVIGMRKKEHPLLRSAVADTAVDGAYVQESCFGSNISGNLKLIVTDTPSALRNFMDRLETDGIISEPEKARAVQDLKLRNGAFHPLLPERVSRELQHHGAGI